MALLTFAALVPASSSHAADRADNPAENTINIAFDPARSSMTGTSRITLPPDTPLKLFCGPLEITGAILEIGGRTPLSLKPTTQNILIIPASPTEQVVYVSWSLLATGKDNNLISDKGITLAGSWHPLPDIDMVYRLEARLPEGFTAISEGEIVTYCLDNLNNRYLTTSFDHPIRSIHFAAGPYTVKSRTLPGDILLSAFFFEEDIELAEEYLDKAQYYLELYQELLGPYPYNRYSIVENRLPTGYGMPTYTLLGQAVVRLPFIKDTSLGHEILHSWFGNSVLTAEDGGNWSEGLTTYLGDHYYAELADQGADYRKGQLLRYASYVPADNDMALRDFNNPSDSQPMARHIRAVGYDKSAMVFHMLRQQLGDDLFFKGLREFYRKYRFTRAGWDEIEKSFTDVTGTDLSPFFDQWLTRRDIPELDITSIDVTQVKGQSTISFTLQQNSGEPYSLLVPVTVKTRTNTVQQTFPVSEQSVDIEMTVDALPVEMIIDPDYDLMRMITVGETPPIWSRFMGAGEKTVVLPVSEKDAEIYAPLLPMLEELGSEMIAADELANEDLGGGSFLFLGSSEHTLGLFAGPSHSDRGVTVDVRENPLSPAHVMAIITSPDREQTGLIARKLRHYGKYSFLYFENGRIIEKNTSPSKQGMRVNLFTEPEAVRVPDIRSFDDIIDEIQSSRVVYVGEMHTDMGSHMLQLQVIQALYQADPDLAVGMEMFPRSSQEALDRYISGAIDTEKEFIKQSDYFNVWGFDYRYYRDIIEYAHRNKIPIVGLNIEKAIVSKVFKEGSLAGLDEEQMQVIPPERKLDAPGYRERLSRAFSSHDQQNFTADKIGGFMQAQSIWDEAMAESIVNYLAANPEKKMVVIAGNGHIYKDNAIPPRVVRRMDIPQSVLTSIHQGGTGLVPGYKVDYLVYTRTMELEPSPKVGVVLEAEKIDDDPDRTRLRIKQISPHGKAGEAGVRENDIILSVEGEKIEDIEDLKILLLDRHPGDTVTMKILREHTLRRDEELDLEVELSLPMQSMSMPPSHPR
ncbi:MAG: ChaN family lipoprotein [Desulfobulbaceae bacterium]|nr:ChaN family lipoprotein [Desulfobulbaceae bacterium]